MGGIIITPVVIMTIPSVAYLPRILMKFARGSYAGSCSNHYIARNTEDYYYFGSNRDCQTPVFSSQKSNAHGMFLTMYASHGDSDMGSR